MPNAADLGPIAATTFTLTPHRFVVRQRVAEALLGELPTVRATIERDAVLGAMLVSLHAKVYGREIANDRVAYPADWWQALKARWFPPWALRRWPVRDRVVHFTACQLFPQLVVPPGLGPMTVYVERHEGYGGRSHA